ncbi:phosphoenolpyruvate carboxylase [Bosea caraganae]|uniref:Phosphoenolpyruvate carboxylase n=1 Tax=Bosea caraganae TaxID=2763117 RepID=A0A370LC42_9HYPH|nr:phosphoenolpyruvate carboxylase [Bosea caraganae]RDJ27403.1 phosphoenolpyruvate carboxylase [Bosea caraganae]RDJ29419.1 phosphoenolpyruvate carboxylase [Bosea caraganae]
MAKISVVAPAGLNPADLAADLTATIAQARRDAREDPFGNPVLRVTLWLTRRMDRGEITLETAAALIRHLGREAIAERAVRVARYVGFVPGGEVAFATVAERLAGDADTAAEPFEAYAASVAKPRFAAVFTAHPTFGMARKVAHALADLASGAKASEVIAAEDLSFRPDATITLQDEFEQARFAVRHARDAIDRFNAAILSEARARWPERWRELAPRPLILASWVGCDTDGRTDIGWWDTLRYRLESKRGQFFRMLEKLPENEATAEVRTLVGNALAAVERQLALAPPITSQPKLEALQAFALSLVGERDAALPEASGLLAALEKAIATASDEETALALALARAGVVAHGVSIALPHFRLNASQLHNAMRGVIPLDEEPSLPAQRRAFLSAVNAELAKVKPTAVDFGALAVERASATRMMMTIAQIVKHVDGTRPVRFLVAETETGYTLLSALWLARRFGIADRIEISPLFETSDALEQGPRIIDEALRSPHWREYLKQHGRLCIQFGYSDSGRYIGQVASTFWVERLRSRIGELLARYGLTDIELVIFDTHGESPGRGAHPDSLADRFAYLDPAWSRRAFAKAGIATVEETSFQGSDGYMLFGTTQLAGATVARIAESIFGIRDESTEDPVYAEPDFATEFFQTVRDEMNQLVDDPGYAALIGTFGPSLLDKTGSRPAARQSDAGGPTRIRHPRELRAIPNNAILQQLGWMANSIHGIGQAASRSPDLFGAMREKSERFGRAYRLANYAMAHSDLDVLRAYLDTLDPGNWFDRARRTDREGRRDELLTVAEALARLDLAPDLRRLFWRFASDRLKLKEAGGEAPQMKIRLVALHALRLCLLHRIWLSATHIPDFRPHLGVTREGLMERILRLDIPGSLTLLAEIFPLNPDPTIGLDFGEPPGPREGGAYEALHRDVIAPMRESFALLREISGVIQHEIGAFG